MIAASKGIRITKPPGNIEAVRDIIRTNGVAGLYTGFRLHFGSHSLSDIWFVLNTILFM